MGSKLSLKESSEKINAIQQFFSAEVLEMIDPIFYTLNFDNSFHSLLKSILRKKYTFFSAIEFWYNFGGFDVFC